MNNLVPTQITDRNGKLTTVHKKAQTASSSKSRIPAPSPVAAPQSVTGTPLSFPEPLNHQEQQGWIDKFLDDNPRMSRSRRRDALTMLSGQEAALIKEIISRGSMDNQSISHIIEKFEHTRHSCVNRLLMAEKFKDEANSKEHFGPRMRYFDAVCSATDGLMRNMPDGAKSKMFTTEEELASAGAVVEFLMDEELRGTHGLYRYIDSENGQSSVNALYIKNKHLDRLIRERPEDIRAIISYVRERGMHASNKGPVEALRKYLDETAEASAVGGGWL